MPDPVAALTPLQDATLANVHRVGAAESLTGPAVRGDAITLQRNLEALAEHVPDAVRPYVTLADLALALAERSGWVPPRGREAVSARPLEVMRTITATRAACDRARAKGRAVGFVPTMGAFHEVIAR